MKNYILLLLLLSPLVNYAQDREEQEYSSRSIQGVFKISNIDSTKSYYMINAVNDKNVEVLILQRKLKRKERKKLLKEGKSNQIIVGQSYYFNLENWFYKTFIYGTANDQIIIDKKVIYDKQKSPYFVYETQNLKGLYLKSN